MAERGRPIDTQLFRDIMSGFPAGVTVVTAMDGTGQPFGLTVSAFCSVSLDPPLVLVCIETLATTLPVIQASGGFTVNFLARGGDAISQRFASKDADKFAGVAWSAPATAGAGPVLDDGLAAYIECTLFRSVDAGDHAVEIGEVRRGWLSEGVEPLVHWHRQYVRVDPEGRTPTARS